MDKDSIHYSFYACFLVVQSELSRFYIDNEWFVVCRGFDAMS